MKDTDNLKDDDSAVLGVREGFAPTHPVRLKRTQKGEVLEEGRDASCAQKPVESASQYDDTVPYRAGKCIYIHTSCGSRTLDNDTSGFESNFPR